MRQTMAQALHDEGRPPARGRACPATSFSPEQTVAATHALTDALAGVYSESLLDEQYRRYHNAIAGLLAYAGPGDVWIFRAPGRVNLIGEHTDYNHGYVLLLALGKDIALIGRPRTDALVRLWNVEEDHFAPRTFTIGREIPPHQLGDWGNYVQAAAQGVARQAGKMPVGMDAIIVGAPPWGTPRAAGLSSSSALVVVTALALATFNGWATSAVDFAYMCSEAEWYVGTRGGIMDHFISVLAKRDHALFLDCRPQGAMANGRPHYHHTEYVRLPQGYRVVIANSGVPRQKTRSQYNVRVTECRLAVAWLRRTHLQITHLRDLAPESSVFSDGASAAALASLPERLHMADVQKDPDLVAVLQTLGHRFPRIRSS